MTTSQLSDRVGSSSDSSFYSYLVLAAVLLVVGGYLRWWAAAGDLWLDELVTLEYLQRLDNPLAIVWGGYFDNNHLLNSLYLYFLPEAEAPRLLRGLSLFCGVISLIFAGLIGLRRGYSGFVIYLTIFALSFPLIHYASEARGYASLMAFWLIALYLTEPREGFELSQLRWSLPLVAVLGILSHIFFVIALAVLALWHWERKLAAGEGFREASGAVTRGLRGSFWIVGLLVCSFIMSWYFYGMEFGALPKGDPTDPARNVALFGNLMAYVMGLPLVLPKAVSAFLVLALLLALYGLHRRLAPERARRWQAFYLLYLFVVPLFFLKFDQLRYHIFFAATLLLVFADCLTSLYQRGRWGAVLCGVLLLAFTAGQYQKLERFAEHGRGESASLLRYMAEESAGPVVTLGGFHAMAEKRLLSGAVRWLPAEKTFRYVGFEEDPEWILVKRGARPLRLCPELELRPGTRHAALLGADNAAAIADSPCPWHLEMPFPDGQARHYRLERLVPYWGLSGLHMALYRRVAPDESDQAAARAGS